MSKRIKWQDDNLVLWGRYRIPFDLIMASSALLYVAAFGLAIAGKATQTFWMSIPVLVLVAVPLLVGLLWAVRYFVSGWVRVFRGK